MRARIRTIKPEAHTDEDLWDLEQETGLPIFRGYVGLWNHADREGRFEWRPRPLKAAILPYWDDDFSRVLDALATRGFVVKYESGGREYGWLPNFTKHQVINNREEGSKIPEPPAAAQESPLPPRVPDAYHTGEPRVPDATLPCTSGREGKGREGKGREGEGKGAARGAPVPRPDPQSPASRFVELQRNPGEQPRPRKDPLNERIPFGAWFPSSQWLEWAKEAGVTDELFDETMVAARDKLTGAHDIEWWDMKILRFFDVALEQLKRPRVASTGPVDLHARLERLKAEGS